MKQPEFKLFTQTPTDKQRAKILNKLLKHLWPTKKEMEYSRKVRAIADLQGPEITIYWDQKGEDK